MFKVISWNINSIRFRLKDLDKLITTYNPDVICLQELKCNNNKFPYENFKNLNYTSYVNGEKSYNGVAIISKIKANNVQINFPNNPIKNQSRFIEIKIDTSIGVIRIISLYAPNGRDIKSDTFNIKLKFYDAFISYIKNIKSLKEKIFICADYNIAPFNIDVYDPDLLRETIGFSLTERKKIRSILNNGFIDNYRIKNLKRQEFSWWDYRGNSFHKNKGMRIDSIITSSNVVQYLNDITIDYTMRAKEKPSDHAPIIACYLI